MEDAKVRLKRLQSLSATQSTSQAKLDESRYEVRALKADQLVYEAHQKMSVIRSPKRAQVLEIFTHPGEKVGSEGVMELRETDRILHLEDGRFKNLADAVGDNASRMLNILARHDPGANSYLATIALALTRVASADQVVTDAETDAIRQILRQTSDLTPGHRHDRERVGHRRINLHR